MSQILNQSVNLRKSYTHSKLWTSISQNYKIIFLIKFCLYPYFVLIWSIFYWFISYCPFDNIPESHWISFKVHFYNIIDGFFNFILIFLIKKNYYLAWKNVLTYIFIYIKININNRMIISKACSYFTLSYFIDNIWRN